MAYTKNPDTQPGKKGGSNVQAIDNQATGGSEIQTTLSGQVIKAYGAGSNSNVDIQQGLNQIGSIEAITDTLVARPGVSAAQDVASIDPSIQNQVYFQPHIYGVTPNVGPLGAALTITGTNFVSGASVTFSGYIYSRGFQGFQSYQGYQGFQGCQGTQSPFSIAANNVVVANSDSISCNVPTVSGPQGPQGLYGNTNIAIANTCVYVQPALAVNAFTVN